MAFIRKNCGIKEQKRKKTMSELKQLEMQKDDEMEIDLGNFSFADE